MTTDSTVSTVIDRLAVREACERFLARWDRQEWLQDHGEWASAEWASEREEYDAALAALQGAAARAPCADRVNTRDDIAELRAAWERLEAAAEALEGAVTPGGDYIATGTLDPDGVADDAEDLPVSKSWQGWDCREGWSAYRVGSALYVRWYRTVYGSGRRHERDLWVKVDGDFFAE